MRSAIIITLLVASSAWLALAQRPPSSCRQVGRSSCPNTSPFDTAEITTDTYYRYVTTTGCPPYQNPNWTNPSVACIFNSTYRLPLNPKLAKVPIPAAQVQEVFENITYLKEDPAPLLGTLGVFRNGVNIFGVGSPCGYSSKCPDNGGPTKYVDAVEAEGHTVDFCGGHAAPTHQYHIHSGTHITTDSERMRCNLPTDKPGQHSVLLGWVWDGFGLYGANSEGGKVPTDLDECGGHTHEIDGVSVYHYHMPSKYPWTIGCFKGCPEVSNNPRELSFTKDSKYGCG